MKKRDRDQWNLRIYFNASFEHVNAKKKTLNNHNKNEGKKTSNYQKA